MRRTTTVETDQGAVLIRELTVSEILDWVAEAEKLAASGDPPNESADLDVVSIMLTDGCSIADLQRMSDITDEKLRSLTQSELAAVVAAAKELNADFFGRIIRPITALTAGAPGDE